MAEGRITFDYDGSEVEIPDNARVITEEENTDIETQKDESQETTEEGDDQTEETTEGVSDESQETAEEGDDQTEETTEGEEEEEGEEEVNPYVGFADTLKGDGLLPDDLEYEGEVDGAFIVDKVKEHLLPRLVQQANQVVEKALVDNGIIQEHLEIAKAIHQGVSAEVLQKGYHYKKLSETDLEEVNDEDKLAIIKFMHTDRGLTPEESAGIISANSDDIEPLAKSAVNYADNKFKAFKADEQARVEQVELQKKQHQLEEQNFYTTLFQKGTLGDEQITQDRLVKLHEGMTKPVEEVNMNGTSYRVTPHQKHEHLMKTSLEYRTKVFETMLNLPILIQQVTNGAKVAAEKNFIKKYPKKKITVDNTIKKKPSDQSRKNHNNNRETIPV